MEMIVSVLTGTDTLYEQLLDTHVDPSAPGAELRTTRLMLLRSTQIGDTRVLAECIAAAKGSDQ